MCVERSANRPSASCGDVGSRSRHSRCAMSPSGIAAARPDERAIGGGRSRGRRLASNATSSSTSSASGSSEAWVRALRRLRRSRSSTRVRLSAAPAFATRRCSIRQELDAVRIERGECRRVGRGRCHCHQRHDRRGDREEICERVLPRDREEPVGLDQATGATAPCSLEILQRVHRAISAFAASRVCVVTI